MFITCYLLIPFPLLMVPGWMTVQAPGALSVAVPEAEVEDALQAAAEQVCWVPALSLAELPVPVPVCQTPCWLFLHRNPCYYLVSECKPVQM